MTRTKEDPADFVLEQVSDLPTKNFTRLQNSAAWKNLLSAEDYVLREHVLSLSKIASSDVNRLVIFVLRAKDGTEPLCSCELLIREAWKLEKTDDKVVKTNVLSGCVGGVFTYEGNRGRGLATIMIDKLVATARSSRFLGESGFIFLYLEVGEFYTRNGFKLFGVPLLNLPLAASGKAFAPRAGVELVRYHEFGDLFREYNAHFEREMRAKVAADGVPRLSVDPTADYVDWFHLRVKYFGVKLFGTKQQFDFAAELYESLVAKFCHTDPTYFGIKLVADGVLEGFVVWQYEFDYDRELQQWRNYATVIKIFVNTPHSDADATTARLLALMKEYLEARHDVPQMQNFTKIVLWESEVSPELLQLVIARYGCTHGLENSSRSAILCNNAADDARLRRGDLVWENNNKLPWF